jgi:hypothetical protein
MARKYRIRYNPNYRPTGDVPHNPITAIPCDRCGRDIPHDLMHKHKSESHAPENSAGQ